MSTGARPLRSVRDISAIAYGFMASKVLYAVLIDPDVEHLSPDLLEERVRAHGFDEVRHVEVIPGLTRALTARRP